MNDTERQTPLFANDTPAPDIGYNAPDPVLRPLEMQSRYDWNSIGGLASVHGLIFVALFLGGSVGAFLDLAAFLIVVLGTFCVTAICFHLEDLKSALPTMRHIFVHSSYDAPKLARALVDMSIIVRKRGTLALGEYERLWRNDPLLYPYIAMVVDGVNPQEIERMASQELDTAMELYRKTSAIIRRAGEIAPGMGLIGTLIGLVQMLGQLQSPETLGPSMAIALLTTFYGAMLGTVILTPLANKVERNANIEATERQMILTAAVAMSVLDNPRRVEMSINAFLPKDQRLSYLTKGLV